MTSYRQANGTLEDLNHFTSVLEDLKIENALYDSESSHLIAMITDISLRDEEMEYMRIT